MRKVEMSDEKREERMRWAGREERERERGREKGRERGEERERDEWGYHIHDSVQ